MGTLSVKKRAKAPVSASAAAPIKLSDAILNRAYACAIAAALRRARPQGPSIEAYCAWSNACREVANALCWAPDAISLNEFYEICGLEL